MISQAPARTKEQILADHNPYNMPYHTEACFQASSVIKCDGKTDLRKCMICGKEWTETN